MPADCPLPCKRASCGEQGHGKVCRIHCASCNPSQQRKPRGRPKKRQRRLATDANVCYAEQDDSEEFLLNSEIEAPPLPPPPPPQGTDALQAPASTTALSVRKTLDRVLLYVGISASQSQKLPSTAIREGHNVRANLQGAAWTRFIKLAKDACQGVLKLLCPNDTAALSDAVWQKVAAPPELDASVNDRGMQLAINIRDSSKNGGVANRVATAILVGTYSRNQDRRGPKGAQCHLGRSRR
jgi:hypothetical protein